MLELNIVQKSKSFTQSVINSTKRKSFVYAKDLFGTFQSVINSTKRKSFVYAKDLFGTFVKLRANS